MNKTEGGDKTVKLLSHMIRCGIREQTKSQDRMRRQSLEHSSAYILLEIMLVIVSKFILALAVNVILCRK